MIWMSRAVCLLLAASVCPPGWAQMQPLRPLSSADSKPTFVYSKFNAHRPLRLVAYGDMRFADPRLTHGTNPRVRAWLADKVGQERPDALLLTGDMPFVGSRAEDWKVFQDETASWRTAGFPVFHTLGNHELNFNYDQGIANYLQNFPQIKGHRHYSAVLGPVEVISLDMNEETEAHSEQTRWLAAQLARIPSAVDFVLILYHVPWVADTQSELVADIPDPQALLLRGVLEANLSHMHSRVVVINGHIHNYERFERKGVEYLVSGGGGAQPYPLLFRGSEDLYRDSGFPVYHYLTLEIKDHQLTGTMWKVKDPDAAELSVEKKDSFVIRAR